MLVYEKIFQGVIPRIIQEDGNLNLFTPCSLDNLFSLTGTYLNY